MTTVSIRFDAKIFAIKVMQKNSSSGSFLYYIFDFEGLSLRGLKYGEPSYEILSWQILSEQNPLLILILSSFYSNL